MEQLKSQTLSREAILTAALVGTALLAPLLHSQLVTGTIVNTTLFVAAMELGFWAAAGVAVIPSLIAVAVGTLPLVLAPLIPLIILSNIALVSVFMVLRTHSYVRAAFLASLAKFLFLASVSSWALNLFNPKVSLPILESALGWPQLITAMTGAVVAYLFVSHKAK